MALLKHSILWLERTFNTSIRWSRKLCLWGRVQHSGTGYFPVWERWHYSCWQSIIIFWVWRCSVWNASLSRYSSECWYLREDRSSKYSTADSVQSSRFLARSWLSLHTLINKHFCAALSMPCCVPRCWNCCGQNKKRWVPCMLSFKNEFRFKLKTFGRFYRSKSNRSLKWRNSLHKLSFGEVHAKVRVSRSRSILKAWCSGDKTILDYV